MNLREKNFNDFRGIALQKLDEHLSHTDKIFGVPALSLALGCVGLDNSQNFALAGLLIIFVAWGNATRSSKPHLDFLRRIGDPSMKPFAMMSRNYEALIGWLFLGLVASGFVHAAA